MNIKWVFIFVFLIYGFRAGLAGGETLAPGVTPSNAGVSVSDEPNQTSFAHAQTDTYLDPSEESPQNPEENPKAVSFYQFRHNPKAIELVTLIKSPAGWEKFWTGIYRKTPKAPTDFKDKMVLEMVQGYLSAIIYKKKETVAILVYPPLHGGMKRDWSKWRPPPPEVRGYFIKKTGAPVHIIQNFIKAK